MNKISITLLVLFVWISTQAKVRELSWQKNPIVTDGCNTDWMRRPGNSDSGSGVLYEAYNDSDNLYLMFEIISETTQTKAMTSGFDISISVKGKPKVHGTIFMPVIEKQDEERGERPDRSENGEEKSSDDERSEKSDDETQREKPDFSKDYKLMTNSAQVINFIENPDAIFTKDTEEGFAYNVGWNKTESMLVEFRIPLLHLFGSGFDLIEAAKKSITITSKFKGLEKPDGEGGSVGMSGGGRMSGGRGGGGGGMPGGGGPSGGAPVGGGPSGSGNMQSGNESTEMQAMSTTNTIKYKVKLASHL